MIETTLHTSLADALQRTIFAPLGLQQTRTAETLEDAQNLTPGCSAYFSPDGTLQDIHTTYHPGWVSHGVVISTAPELAQIYTALFHGSLLTPASLTAMQTALDVPARHPQFQQPGYGLGLMIDQASPHGFVAGHGGGGPGYSTGALHFSNLHGHRLTSIALVNTDRGDLGLELASKLAHRAAELLNEG